jgi:hypothetical protein
MLHHMRRVARGTDNPEPQNAERPAEAGLGTPAEAEQMGRDNPTFFDLRQKRKSQLAKENCVLMPSLNSLRHNWRQMSYGQITSAAAVLWSVVGVRSTPAV